MKDSFFETFKKLTSYKINEGFNFKEVPESYDDMLVKPQGVTQDGTPVPVSGMVANEAEDVEEIKPTELDNDSDSEENNEFDDNIENEPVTDGENDVEEESELEKLQNDVIKANTKSLIDITKQIDTLTKSIKGVEDVMTSIKRDVEEVREPSSGEKLNNMAQHSKPYDNKIEDFYKEKSNSFSFNKGGSDYIFDIGNGTYVGDYDVLKSKLGLYESYRKFVKNSKGLNKTSLNENNNLSWSDIHSALVQNTNSIETNEDGILSNIFNLEKIVPSEVILKLIELNVIDNSFGVYYISNDEYLDFDEFIEVIKKIFAPESDEEVGSEGDVIYESVDWEDFYNLSKDTSGERFGEYQKKYGDLVDKPHISDAIRKSKSYDEFIKNIKGFEKINEGVEYSFDIKKKR